MTGLRNSSKCTRLLGELKNIRVGVAAVQETDFICAADCRGLENDFNVFSAYDSCSSAGVSLLVGRSQMLKLALFLQVTGTSWLQPMLPLKV